MNTPTLIACVIIIVIVAAVFISFIRRLSSKQTCCGTEKAGSHRKKIKNAAGRMIFHVDGMHCQGCKSSIENKINALDGLAAKADLEKKTVTVSYSPGKTPDPDMIITILGDMGFTASELVL